MKILKYLALLLFMATTTPLWSQKPESDARYLSITSEYQLMPDGSQSFHYSHQLKYLTHRAFHNLFGESFVVYNPEVQKLKVNKSVTTMRDGKVTPTPANGYNEVLPHFAAHAARVNHLREMVITHTGLEVGCTVDLDYTLTTSAGYLPGLFDQLTLAEPIPADQYTIIVKIPSGTPLIHTLVNLRLAPQITTEGKFDVYTWKVGTTKAIPSESLLPEKSDWLPTLRFSTLASVFATYDWFVNQPLFTSKALPLNAVNKIKTIQETEKDPFALTMKLRDLVSRRMDNLDIPSKYLGHRYQTIDQVWNANAGTVVERTVLLAALLNEAGIRAEALAVCPSNVFELNTANPEVFNQMVVSVQLPDEPVFYITANQSATDASYLFPGQMLVKLEPAAESIHKSPVELTPSALKMKGQLTIQPDGKVTGDATINMLWGSNPWLKTKTNNQSIGQYLTGFSTKGISELKATKINKEQTEAYLKIADGAMLSEIAPGIYSMPIPGFNNGVNTWGLQSLPTERTAPVGFPAVHAESSIFTIIIPEGFTLLTPLVNLTKKTEWGNLMLEIRQRGNQITVHRGFETTTQTIGASEYSALRETTNRWNNEMYQRLIFKKQ